MGSGVLNRSEHLDRRITLQRATSTPNEFNEPVLTWGDLATVWAGRRDVTDGEKFAAGQVGGFVQARFTVRSSTLTRSLLPSDRLQHDGATWSIHGMKEGPGGRHRFIEITATKDAD